MFVHHVFFWLKDPHDTHARAQLLKGLASLEQIEPKIDMQIGVPAPTNRDVIDSSYSFSLLITFDSADHEAAYQTHPTHLKFVDENSNLWSKVQVYDSIDAQTP